jgi:DNA sulfur modification protein DndD
MEVKKVTFNNFKPYFGVNEIDLSVNPEQNIVLIGGKNGQGKTSFLVGLVWCIYGKNLSNVDKSFSKEIKGGNYSKFLANALNRKSEESGASNFSVTIDFDHVELSKIFTSSQQNTSTVTLTRSYDTKTGVEDFKILMDGNEVQLITDEEEKINFVNDYIIPIEAAKFVFFDAEKISDIAELNIKDQGQVMNEALGKILGLSQYEDLIISLETYIVELKKKREQNTQVARQIESFENKIKINIDEIERIEQAEIDNDEELKKLENSISQYNNYLSQIGGKALNIDTTKLEIDKKDLEDRLKKLGEKLHEISEIIPFAISSGKIQELVEHINIEQNISNKQNSRKELRDKAQQFIELLFEEPPFPDDDLKTRSKVFYMDKAEKVFSEVYFQEEEEQDLLFHHDLNKSNTEHIFAIYNRLKNGEDMYQSIFNEHIRIKNDINDIVSQLNKAKSKAGDETIIEYKEKLSKVEKERQQRWTKHGENQNMITRLKTENTSVKEKLENLLNKVEVSKQDQTIIDDVNKHIKTLTLFIEDQKNEKCKSLAENIMEGMNQIMHKKDLFDNIKVNILPENQGLEVVLYKGVKEIPKEQMSSGEKQIYISCLLQAILKESVTEFPVFIDTPLARFDSEHKDKFVTDYYTKLANQVIILTTDEEVSVKRKETIKEKVANTYLLVNQDNQTQILNEYF